jgi:hypothetical protein
LFASITEFAFKVRSKGDFSMFATDNLTRANLFELSGETLQISFGSSNLLGGPGLSYRDQTSNQSFQGEEIQILETALGEEITVTLESIPDLRTVTFTLVLPIVTVLQQSHGTCIQTFGVTTTNPTTIAGPPPGPQKQYSVALLRGNAQFIVS